MFEREDYLDLQKRKKKENGKADERLRSLEFLAQAELHQKHLTGRPEWDRFLSYIEATAKNLRLVKQQLTAALCSPQMVDQNDIIATKLALAKTDGALEMGEAVLSLPKDIIETGEKAREKLDKLVSEFGRN